MVTCRLQYFSWHPILAFRMAIQTFWMASIFGDMTIDDFIATPGGDLAMVIYLWWKQCQSVKDDIYSMDWQNGHGVVLLTMNNWSHCSSKTNPFATSTCHKFTTVVKDTLARTIFNLCRNSFAHGQLYTVISRVRNHRDTAYSETPATTRTASAPT